MDNNYDKPPLENSFLRPTSNTNRDIKSVHFGSKIYENTDLNSKAIEAGEINDSFESEDDVEKYKEANEIKSEALPESNDFQKPAKLDLIVGFLRLLNFLSCCTSVFAVVISIFYPANQSEPSLRNIWTPIDFQGEDAFYRNKRETRTDEELERKDFLLQLKAFAGIIQLFYVLVTALFIIIDSIATVTFRWKEYGELTHRHTDATSVVFLVSQSRWNIRFIMCLTISSAASLQTTQIILRNYGQSLETEKLQLGQLIHPNQVPAHAFHAVVWYLCLLCGGLFSFSIGYALHLLPTRWLDVPWLDNLMDKDHVDDKGDLWKSTKQIICQTGRPYDRCSIRTSSYKQLTCFGYIVESLKKIVYFLSYVSAISMNLRAIFLMELSIDSFEFWTCIISTTCTTLISLYLVMLMSSQCIKLPPKPTPFVYKGYVPFVLSSSLRLLLDLRKDVYGQFIFAYIYIVLLVCFFSLQLFSTFTKKFTIRAPVNFWFYKFISFNFVTNDGAYKKVVRLFDTLGSLFGLVGLVLGLFSLLMDQYDVEFELQGELKEAADGLRSFVNGLKDISDGFKEIINAIDFKITCELVYSTLATGSAAAFILSIVPGAGSVTHVGNKFAYYSVKAGSALSKLARMLRRSAKNLWSAGHVIFKASKFAAGNFKKFTIGGSSVTLLRLLPFVPPVVVGIHILFAAFWPKRILFFHSSQRRRFMSGMYSHWRMILILLVLSLTINTYLIDELQRAFNESLPLLNVHIHKKFGWKISIAASSFSIASAIAFMIAYYTLQTKTDKDHENITNEEKEWKMLVESKGKYIYNNAFGPKIEWKNQLKYKKERIGPWNWALPIALCLVACGFGVIANLYPKIDIHKEPNGAFGRALDKMFLKFAVYEEHKKIVKEYGDQECLPFVSFRDVLKENMDMDANILMNPIKKFFDISDRLMGNLTDVLKRTRKQFIADVGDNLFGEDVAQSIKDLKKLDLQYIGMLLLIPRVICLGVLLLGMITMSCATKDMAINPDREPKKIVDDFGKVCVFSVVFVLGAQLSVFNILTDIGIPFYKVSVRLGLGFIYDLVCDCIMISIWIGMKNEYFFAIPKKKVTVSYSVPGVSDSGPNPDNRIL